MKYYSAVKKNETLPFATTWMDVEDIMLSEIIQTEKGKHYMYLFWDTVEFPSHGCLQLLRKGLWIASWES